VIVRAMMAPSSLGGGRAILRSGVALRPGAWTGWARALATPAPVRRPSAAELLASSKELVAALDAPHVVQQLSNARAGGDTLVKWVTCNMMLTQQAAMLAQKLPGLGATNEGVSAFLELLLGGAEAVGADASTASELRAHNRERWSVLLKHGFGCELGPPLDLAGARALAIGIVDAMQDRAFMRKVSELMRGELMAQLSPVEKQQAVTRLMIIKQKEAIVPFGFGSSDEGYAQAQAALQTFALDAVIQGAMMHITQRVYLSAGIDFAELMSHLSKGQAMSAGPR
jgi:hypothetical protein